MATSSSLWTDQDAWAEITKASSRTNRGGALVAVPWVTNASLLDLREGDIAVIDFSDQAIKSGQTDPREVLKWIKQGVEVHQLADLHSKVFVFGTTAFIGSTNVSRNSATNLREAVVRTNDPKVVKEARDYIAGLVDQASKVTAPQAKRARDIYRPPQRGLPLGQRANPTANSGRAPLVWLTNFTGSMTASAERFVDRERATVAARARAGDSMLRVVEWFEERGTPLSVAEGDVFVDACYLDDDDEWFLVAGVVVSTSQIPATRSNDRWILWLLEPENLGISDTDIEELRPLRIPAPAKWADSRRLSQKKGLDVLKAFWPAYARNLSG